MADTPNPQRQDIIKEFRLRNIIWPLLIGIGVLGYAIYQIVDETQQTGENPLQEVQWTVGLFAMLLLGLLCMFLRDLGYIWRMRLLTDKQLSWRSAAEVILLWEFGSALTPSVVGGSALAIFMLIREKISAGKSTALVFITIFLDECFYILIFPLVLLFTDYGAVFGASTSPQLFGMTVPLEGFFWAAYLVLLTYTCFLAFALFVRPAGTNKVIRRIFTWKRLQRWKEGGIKLADELRIASEEFRGKSFLFWARAGASTFLAWMGRYLALNCVLAAFVVMDFNEHLTAFARQVILFQVMLVSPSPGASGFAETTFLPLFREFLQQGGLSSEALVYIVALLWRFVTYYPYLIIGAILLPLWLRRVYRKSGNAS